MYLLKVLTLLRIINSVAETWVEQLLILQLLEKYKCSDKQMQRKYDTIIYVVRRNAYVHGQKLEDNFTNKWEFTKVGKTHKTHNPNIPKWNLTRTLKWKLSQILSKNSLAIALYFSQIGMLRMNDHSSIYSWALPFMLAIFKAKVLSSFQIVKGRCHL